MKFTIGFDTGGKQVQLAVGEMTPNEVLAAVTWQRNILAALEVARDQGHDAVVPTLPAERAREDALHTLIQNAMPRWQPRRRPVISLENALDRWWPT
jgi:hypothetical protein